MISKDQDTKRREETILLCIKFLETNASDKELSEMTNISSSTVGRRLTNKAYIEIVYSLVKEGLIENGFKEEIPENGEKLFELIAKKRQDNLLRGKAIGGQTTLLNHVYLKDEQGKFEGSAKLSLEVFYRDKEKQYKFLINAALHFRLHLDTLQSLFNIPEKELLDNMITVGSNVYEHLKILFYHDSTNQEKARRNFVMYYHDLLEALRHKNRDEQARLLSIIGDSKAVSLKKKIRECNLKNEKLTLSEEDIETLLKYQLKYMLSGHEISYVFDIDRKNYNKRIQTFLEMHEDYRERYETLADYNTYKYKQGERRG